MRDLIPAKVEKAVDTAVREKDVTGKRGEKMDIFRRIGFTVVFLLASIGAGFIILYPIRLLEKIIGDYIILVLLFVEVCLIQAVYSLYYRYDQCR